MKKITEKDALDAINRGIAVYTEAAEKEGRENTPWEKKQIEDALNTIKIIKRNAHYFPHIVELVNKKYIEESIILTVTFFEFLMRDLVKFFKAVWFYFPLFHFSELPLDKKLVIRKKIKKYLKSKKLYNQYIRNTHLYQDSPDLEIEALYHTLFDEERDLDRINFQNIVDVKEIVNFLYDINIVDCLDLDKTKSHRKYNSLEKLIKDRHEIIHKGDPATRKPEEIIEVIKTIGELEHNILQKLLRFGIGEQKKQHALLMENLERKIRKK